MDISSADSVPLLAVYLDTYFARGEQLGATAASLME